MPPRKVPFAALPALLFAGGLAAVFYCGDLMWRSPIYSAEEIEQSIDINLALQQAKTSSPDAVDEVSRSAVRQALLDEIARERRQLQIGMVAGALAAALGFARMLALRARAGAG